MGTLGFDAVSGGAVAPLIAIVDDDASVRLAMDGLVRSAGYRSVVFNCGAAFLASGRRQLVDCLILDIEMPGMDGLYASGNWRLCIIRSRS